MTTFLNSSDDRSRSISFRSIILIMIYAGTIILNLLAASVDNSLPTVRAQPPENSTIAEASAMDAMEKDNTVSMPTDLSPFHNRTFAFRTTTR